ncbi:DUF2867 domain-containing protein [Methylobacterium goesingense]|uniref:DUF2867 domain-containing protein n=1 Tax=Methylobacterium goesingense TaxID=243690 RepID=A0ABV2L7A1_9HYPH|nr:DUF2867 domain-containing protein [Methylobacterium goesingense]GJD76662.1 hypothetical protein CFIICLFH_4920 [Methylobacterium goesingense]
MAATPPVRTLRPCEELDYHDTRSIERPGAVTPLAVWNFITAKPRPILRRAFRVRDAIAARFGVKALGGFSGKQHAGVSAGDRLDFFRVEHSDREMLVLTERDRHLDVMLCIATSDRWLSITTSVVVHNTFGRAYMVPVGPVHRLIVADELRRLRRKFEGEAARPSTS